MADPSSSSGIDSGLASNVAATVLVEEAVTKINAVAVRFVSGANKQLRRIPNLAEEVLAAVSNSVENGATKTTDPKIPVAIRKEAENIATNIRKTIDRIKEYPTWVVDFTKDSGVYRDVGPRTTAFVVVIRALDTVFSENISSIASDARVTAIPDIDLKTPLSAWSDGKQEIEHALVVASNTFRDEVRIIQNDLDTAVPSPEFENEAPEGPPEDIRDFLIRLNIPIDKLLGNDPVSGGSGGASVPKYGGGEGETQEYTEEELRAAEAEKLRRVALGQPLTPREIQTLTREQRAQWQKTRDRIEARRFGEAYKEKAAKERVHREEQIKRSQLIALAEREGRGQSFSHEQAHKEATLARARYEEAEKALENATETRDNATIPEEQAAAARDVEDAEERLQISKEDLKRASKRLTIRSEQVDAYNQIKKEEEARKNKKAQPPALVVRVAVDPIASVQIAVPAPAVPLPVNNGSGAIPGDGVEEEEEEEEEKETVEARQRRLAKERDAAERKEKNARAAEARKKGAEVLKQMRQRVEDSLKLQRAVAAKGADAKPDVAAVGQGKGKAEETSDEAVTRLRAELEQVVIDNGRLEKENEQAEARLAVFTTAAASSNPGAVTTVEMDMLKEQARVAEDELVTSRANVADLETRLLAAEADSANSKAAQIAAETDAAVLRDNVDELKVQLAAAPAPVSVRPRRAIYTSVDIDGISRALENDLKAGGNASARYVKGTWVEKLKDDPEAWTNLVVYYHRNIQPIADDVERTRRAQLAFRVFFLAHRTETFEISFVAHIYPVRAALAHLEAYATNDVTSLSTGLPYVTQEKDIAMDVHYEIVSHFHPFDPNDDYAWAVPIEFGDLRELCIYAFTNAEGVTSAKHETGAYAVGRLGRMLGELQNHPTPFPHASGEKIAIRSKAHVRTATRTYEWPAIFHEMAWIINQWVIEGKIPLDLQQLLSLATEVLTNDKSFAQSSELARRDFMKAYDDGNRDYDALNQYRDPSPFIASAASAPRQASKPPPRSIAPASPISEPDRAVMIDNWTNLISSASALRTPEEADMWMTRTCSHVYQHGGNMVAADVPFRKNMQEAIKLINDRKLLSAAARSQVAAISPALKELSVQSKFSG